MGDGMNNLIYWGLLSFFNFNNENLGGFKFGLLRKLIVEDELFLVLIRLCVGMFE